MTVQDMEEAVFHRTGQEFYTLHDIVKKTELGSHGIEDFIDNDSKLFILKKFQVWSTFDFSYYQLPWPEEVKRLNLSNTRITSCRDLVTKCLEERNAYSAVLSNSTIMEDNSAWPFGVLDILCWFCPLLQQVDLTGCADSFRNNLSNTFYCQSRIKIIDYLDPSYILNCKDAIGNIREILSERNSFLSSSNGWSLLHSAILLGNKELVKQLFAYIKENIDDNNNIYRDYFQTSLELAIVLHRCDIVELFQNETHLSISPSRLLQLCFLPEHGISSFDHPVEMLTSSREALQAVRSSHNRQDCNLVTLLQIFCNNCDKNFKTKLMEGLLQKVQECTVPSYILAFSCWNEEEVRETVQILMKETGCPANGKIDGFPYLMFSMPSVQLAEFLLQEGAQIDEKDQLGCTCLFHAVERALTSVSHQMWGTFIKFLLRSKANPNARNDLSETPLLYSLSSQCHSCAFCSKIFGHDAVASASNFAFEVQVVDIWRLLLEAEARPNVRDEKDRSVLHMLMTLLEDGVFEVCEGISMVCSGIKVLRDYGFEINSRDAEGNTPLHLWASLTIKANSDEAIRIGSEIMALGGAVNARNDKGETPLHLAQYWRQVEVLVAKGAQVDVRDVNGDTPFHKFTGKISLTKDKVKKGAWKRFLALGMNPWEKNSDGKCPFEVLLEKELFISASTLLKAIFGDDQNQNLAESARRYKDSKGDSLLHNLCIINDDSAQTICEYLLQNGCDTNVTNEYKQTPLHVVCSKVRNMGSSLPKQMKNYIRLLRRYNADVTIPDVYGDNCRALLSGNEHLKNLIDEDIERAVIPKKIKWISESDMHKAALSQVVCGARSQKVESYHHHENPIGQGSFSLVFPAINEKDGREVALKRLEKARLEEKGTVLEREVKCLLKLSSCSYVVNYIDCTRDSNFEYIVVELMEGTLDTYLSCDCECEQASNICLNIAIGIEFLHKSNVLHRDLKPQNILYKTKPNFIIKISDFGLSKLQQTCGGSDSVMHSKAGTRCWMAPELLEKKPKVHSKASDIYSCGLIFHYVLSKKKHPFSNSSGESCLINCHETEDNMKKNNHCLCPSLSPEALHLITNMLLLKPKRRPTSSSLQNVPFFWDDRKKVNFLKSVGNQKEFEEPRSRLTRHLTDVEKKLEDFYLEWLTTTINGWEDEIKDIYDDVTSGYSARRYDTKSAVELVRFIRNSYSHVCDLSSSSKTDLLDEFVVLKRFPYLVTELYKAVKASDTWMTRKDLRHFFK